MSVKVSAATPLLVAVVVVTAGCASASSSATSATSASPSASAPVVQDAVPAPSGYWTEQRLLAAQEFRPDDWSEPASASTPTAREGVKTLRVGALFYGDGSSGKHFCTGSVVDSPDQDVIVTAAHCLNDGTGGASRTDVAFIPAYADGQTPYGIWQPAKYVLDPRWVNGHDDNLDVAFVVLKPHAGKNIQQVLGANKIEFNPGFDQKVRVTGYPASADAPIACDNSTGKRDPDYLSFACANFYGGTSGSPWVTNYNAQTRTGTIVGVLGGYEEGGSTPDVSYSDYLGDDIKKMYERAIADQG